ncbi:sodium/calcium exchanger 1b isoform X3 [Ictalurus furcatus]|uniref:sodium/calcium exchanger 1b isoform X3 n=1 Tax=Ictalurus furcatus TaxID=66913 RepID=UPI00234FCADF|nr:sodium/calcium exchanger 1b isoform X3 [Ictalurus furcatus]
MCAAMHHGNCITWKTISVCVLDREEYNKQCSFYLVLETPQWKRRGHTEHREEVKDVEKEEAEPLTGEDEEERRIAEMGKPMLGEHVKLEIIIEESYEFKNTVDKLIKKTNLALLVGTNSWRDQFIEAITVSAGEDDDDEECGEEKLPSCFDYVMHFLTVFWKVLFAFVPPTDYWNGWACFVVSIIMIGVLTAFIGDLASHFGCTVGLKDSVTAVVFVALGTSVPGQCRMGVRQARGRDRFHFVRKRICNCFEVVGSLRSVNADGSPAGDRGTRRSLPQRLRYR